MTDRIEPCAYGCKINRNHRSECQTEACPGCLPRPAETGQLCAWCYRRLAEDVALVPGLMQHLEEMGRPFASTARYGREGGTKQDPAEGDIYPEAWHARDALGTAMWGWCVAVATERLGLPYPTVSRGETASDWVAPHLEWAAGQDWAADMRAELAALVSTARARWPLMERSKHVEVPCPRCGLLTLVSHPPSRIGAALIVSCDNPDCSRVFSEDEWERAQGLALAIGTA